MTVEEQILSILLNSKKANQLPTATSYDSTDWAIFWDTSLGKLVKMSMSSLVGNVSVSDEFLGTVTTSGNTTITTEIEDYINAQGFTVDNGTIKALKVVTYLNTVPHTKTYFFKTTVSGDFGTSASNEIAYTDLLEVEDRAVYADSEITTVIDLGDIGTDTIEDYINATNSSDYNLLVNTIYVFRAVISSVETYYLYVGTQPILLGLGNNAVTSDDFIEIGASEAAVGAYDGLSDTPNSKVGNALKFIRVNAGETAHEYVTITSSDLHFEHDQSTPSSSWSINHSLSKFPSVTIVDTSGNEVEGDVQHTDNNNLTISFSASFSGKAYLN